MRAILFINKTLYFFCCHIIISSLSWSFIKYMASLFFCVIVVCISCPNFVHRNIIFVPHFTSFISLSQCSIYLYRVSICYFYPFSSVMLPLFSLVYFFSVTLNIFLSFFETICMLFHPFCPSLLL